MSVAVPSSPASPIRRGNLVGRHVASKVARAPTSVSRPRVSRLARLVYVKNQPALRRHLERLAAIPDLKRLIVSHEKVASGPDASAALRQAATYLKAS